MKVTLKWLKDFVDITLPPADVASRLTMAGLEVKERQTIGGNWENIMVGQITSVNPHPNADRLSLITVDIGAEPVTVVSGAPNLRTGDKVAFARVGAQLTDGHTGQRIRLKPARIRGILSSGMACSEKELGISDSHEGIMILPADIPVGTPLSEYLGDTILDLEITPNRADCLSVIGIAREVAALTGKAVKLPEISYEETTLPIDRQVSVEITAPDLCPRYCASLITGIKLAPSPAWMQHRLLACGMRPINNIVDITNYVMLEYGQPLHAFDYDRIRGKKIIVRRASAGEPMTTLDGVERTLTPDMLVIADAEHAVAIAGIMGGADSEVTDETASILLEAANFKPASIYHTGHNLTLPSEARLRFERGIRPEMALPALRRATQLIVDIAGGKAARGIVDVYPGKRSPEPIRLSAAQVNRLLGTQFTTSQIVAALSSPGFDCRPADPDIMVTPPYWRNDANLDVDLVEEVARITGYDKIPTTMLSQPIPYHDPDPLVRLKREVRRSLIGYGFLETVTYSLIGLEMLNRLTTELSPPGPMLLRVANPMTAEQEYLRPTLRASLLAAYAANRRYEEDSIRLFEIDKVYLPRPADLPEERYMLCGILGGARWQRSWYGGGEPVDFFDAKGVVEGVLGRLGIDASFEKYTDGSLHPRQQAAVVVNGDILGAIGEVHPKVRIAFEIPELVYIFEIDVTGLAPLVAGYKQFQPIPRFPAVARDIALVVDNRVTHRQIQDIIEDFPLVRQVSIFDLYAGGQIPPGKKSLAYRLSFQSPDHTLTDEEANKVLQQILDKLSREFGAILRS